MLQVPDSYTNNRTFFPRKKGEGSGSQTDELSPIENESEDEPVPSTSGTQNIENEPVPSTSGTQVQNSDSESDYDESEEHDEMKLRSGTAVKRVHYKR